MINGIIVFRLTWRMEKSGIFPPGHMTKQEITPVVSISFNDPPEKVHAGSSHLLSVTVQTASESYENEYVTFSSSDPSVMTVNAAGQISALAEGKATITAAAENGVPAGRLYRDHYFLMI